METEKASIETLEAVYGRSLDWARILTDKLNEVFTTSVVCEELTLDEAKEAVEIISGAVQFFIEELEFDHEGPMQ